MSKLVFELSDGVDGEIQLRDNAFMDFWKMVFIRNNKLMQPSASNKKAINIDEHPLTDVIENKPVLINYADRVNNAIDELTKAGFSWTHGKLTRDSDWADCNRLHRGFTTSSWSVGLTDHIDIPFDKLIYLKYHSINFRSYESKFLIPWLDPSINIPLDIFDVEHPRSWKNYHDHAKDPLHTINAYIHNLEDKCLKSARYTHMYKDYMQKYYNNFNYISIYKCDWDSKGEDGVTDAIECDWNFADLKKDYGLENMCSSDPKYNVYDLKNILGKDYETAYVDYDSPANWDVCNTFNTTKGGFDIRPWQSYWTREVIAPWVETFNIPSEDQIIAPIAIGSIDEDWLKLNCFTKYAFDLHRHIVKVDLV